MSAGAACEEMVCFELALSAPIPDSLDDLGFETFQILNEPLDQP